LVAEGERVTVRESGSSIVIQLPDTVPDPLLSAMARLVGGRAAPGPALALPTVAPLAVPAL
jgi:hypothetical protein